MERQAKRYQSSSAPKAQENDINLEENERKRRFLIPNVIDLSQEPALGIHFNKDKRFYTPAFLHESQDAFYKHNDQALKIKFQQKTSDARNTKKQNIIIQPKDTRKFCYVCKESFSDYTKHINHPYHTRRIEESSCKQSINDLCQIFKSPKRLMAFQMKGNNIYQRSPRKRLKKQKQECDQFDLSVHTISDTFWSE